MPREKDNPIALAMLGAIGVFLAALVATRQRRAGGALCLPPSPRTLVAPLPQKSHTATRVAIFGDPVILMARILLGCRNFTLSVSRGIGKYGARAKSVVFALASNY